MFIHPQRFFACLLMVCGLFFQGIANSSLPASDNSSYPCGDCDEPAPDNFRIEEVGAEFVKVIWDLPSNPPAEYNIKVFEVGSGILVDEFNVPGTSESAGIASLSPNTTYEIRNTPKCADGELSVFNVSGITTTLIVDLVASGFTPPASLPNCTLTGAGQYCFADPSEGYTVPFKIRHGSNGVNRWFGIFGNADDCPYSTTKVRPQDDGSPFEFFCSGGDQAYCSGGKIIIKRDGEVVAEFVMIETPGSPRKLAAGFLASGYQIVRYGNQGGFPDPSEGGCNSLDRSPIQQNDQTNLDNNPFIQVTPNPFNDQILVQLPEFQEHHLIMLTLTDLQGRTVMTQYAPADHSTVTLPTRDLTPGMYFLRADLGYRIETVKLVKMQ
jgi:hypothetical protein